MNAHAGAIEAIAAVASPAGGMELLGGVEAGMFHEPGDQTRSVSSRGAGKNAVTSALLVEALVEPVEDTLPADLALRWASSR